MRDSTMKKQNCFNAVPDCFRTGPITAVHDDMCINRRLVSAHLPEMDMMRICHAFDSKDAFDYIAWNKGVRAAVRKEKETRCSTHWS